jgi:uroporphyrinogen-III synthase
LNKAIFISKSIEELELLPKFCSQNDIQLYAESLIRFEGVFFENPEKFDVVFFASVRAAHFFLEHQPLPSSILVACIGQTTARKLQELGLDVRFIGENSGVPDAVAKQFKEWLGKRTVLFPQSSISKRSISKFLTENQVVERTVYKTVSACMEIPLCGIYIFTSPSNVQSFLSCNKSIDGKIIAWGETTKATLESHGFYVSKTLFVSDEVNLITALIAVQEIA